MSTSCTNPRDKLTYRLRRRYLQGYFLEVTSISRVWTDETSQIARGYAEFTWHQLCEVVRHACATYDQARLTSRHRQRAANVHSLGDYDDDGEHGSGHWQRTACGGR